MERFERLGEQIMHRSGGGLMDANPFMATLGDRNKARAGRGPARAGVRRRLVHGRARTARPPSGSPSG